MATVTVQKRITYALSLILLFNSLASSIFANPDDKADGKPRVRVGNIAISGGGLQLIGTFSTSSSQEKSPLQAVGWTLIVVGSLVEAGDITSAQGAEIPRESVYRSMLAEARASLTSPELTSQRAIKFAVQEFETDPSLEEDAKIKLFAQLVMDVDAMAKEIKAARSQDPGLTINVDKLAKDLLGKNASKKNVTMVTHLFVLSGVTDQNR